MFSRAKIYDIHHILISFGQAQFYAETTAIHSKKYRNAIQGWRALTKRISRDTSRVREEQI